MNASFDLFEQVPRGTQKRTVQLQGNTEGSYVENGVATGFTYHYYSAPTGSSAILRVINNAIPPQATYYLLFTSASEGKVYKASAETAAIYFGTFANFRAN